MVYCSECGYEDRSGSTYCLRCGARLTVEGAGTQVTVVPHPYGGQPIAAPGPNGSRKGTAIIVVVAILACIIIAAALLVVFDEKNAPADGLGSERGIKNGSWAEYRMSISGENLFTYGTCRVTYSNVTEHSYVMTMTMTANGETVTETMTIFQRGSVWEAEGPGIPGLSAVVIGEETTQTPIGLKNTTHTKTVTPDYIEDDWFHSSGCIIKADVSYTDGSSMSMVLVGTNIECVWD